MYFHIDITSHGTTHVYLSIMTYFELMHSIHDDDINEQRFYTSLKHLLD